MVVEPETRPELAELRAVVAEQAVAQPPLGPREPVVAETLAVDQRFLVRHQAEIVPDPVVRLVAVTGLLAGTRREVVGVVRAVVPGAGPIRVLPVGRPCWVVLVAAQVVA